MINIDVILTPIFFNQHNTENKTIIVIDVLRATTSITCLLAKGAKSIIPIDNFNLLGVEKKNVNRKYFNSNEFKDLITKFKEQNPDKILAGEIESKKIPNFDYGNSPYEFFNNDFSDKEVILYTTNGTKTLNLFRNNPNVFVASFLNYGFIADIVGMMKKDVTIVCSGDNNNISYEDILLAGALIQEFHEIYNFNVKLSDTSKLCLYNFLQNENNLVKTIRSTQHSIELMEKGFHQDIDLSIKLNMLNIIPIYKDGLITSL